MVCMCTLAGTRACLNCPNNTSFNYFSEPIHRTVVREIYDENGHLKERVTETGGN